MNPQDKLGNSANSLPELNLSQPAASYAAFNPLQTNSPEAPPLVDGAPSSQPVSSGPGNVNPLMQIQETAGEGTDSGSFTRSPSFISNPKDKKLVSEQYIVEIMKVIEQTGQDPFKQAVLIEQVKMKYLQDVHHYAVKQSGAQN